MNGSQRMEIDNEYIQLIAQHVINHNVHHPEIIANMKLS
jgi:hypothetical protein